MHCLQQGFFTVVRAKDPHEHPVSTNILFLLDVLTRLVFTVVAISPFGAVLAARPGSEILPHALAMKKRFTVGWHLTDAQTLIAPPGSYFPLTPIF